MVFLAHALCQLAGLCSQRRLACAVRVTIAGLVPRCRRLRRSSSLATWAACRTTLRTVWLRVRCARGGTSVRWAAMRLRRVRRGRLVRRQVCSRRRTARPAHVRVFLLLLGGCCAKLAAVRVWLLFAAGKICPEAGMTSAGEDCPEGFYCPGGDAAGTQKCTEGHRCVAGQSVPEPCPAGKYQGAEGRSECDTCPEGYFCLEGSVTPSDCPAGYYCEEGTERGTQRACPAGKYSDRINLASKSECKACEPGSVCGVDGLTGGVSSSRFSAFLHPPPFFLSAGRGMCGGLLLQWRRVDGDATGWCDGRCLSEGSLLRQRHGCAGAVPAWDVQ